MNHAILLAIFIIAGALASAAIGYSVGLIRQVCSLAALFLGYVAAGIVGAQLAGMIGVEQVFGEALVFLIIYIIIMTVARILHVTVKMVLLGSVNKVAGGAFGLVQWLLIVSLLLNLLADKVPADLLGTGVTQWTQALLPRLLEHI